MSIKVKIIEEYLNSIVGKYKLNYSVTISDKGFLYSVLIIQTGKKVHKNS